MRVVEKYDERECKELKTKKVWNKKDKERRTWKQRQGRITEEAKRRRSLVSKNRLSPFRNGSRYSLTVPHYQVNGQKLRLNNAIAEVPLYCIYRIPCSKKRLQMHVSANDVITESGKNKAGQFQGQLTSGYFPGGATATATASVATSHSNFEARTTR